MSINMLTRSSEWIVNPMRSIGSMATQIRDPLNPSVPYCSDIRGVSGRPSISKSRMWLSWMHRISARPQTGFTYRKLFWQKYIKLAKIHGETYAWFTYSARRCAFPGLTDWTLRDFVYIFPLIVGSHRRSSVFEG